MAAVFVHGLPETSRINGKTNVVAVIDALRGVHCQAPHIRLAFRACHLHPGGKDVPASTPLADAVQKVHFIEALGS
jgi:hypothetical protein